MVQTKYPRLFREKKRNKNVQDRESNQEGKKKKER